MLFSPHSKWTIASTKALYYTKSCHYSFIPSHSFICLFIQYTLHIYTTSLIFIASFTGLKSCPRCFSPSLQMRQTNLWSFSQKSLSCSSCSEHNNSCAVLGVCCFVLRCCCTASTTFLRTRLPLTSCLVKICLHSGHLWAPSVDSKWLVIHCLQKTCWQGKLTGSLKSLKHTGHMRWRDSVEAMKFICLESSDVQWKTECFRCCIQTSVKTLSWWNNEAVKFVQSFIEWDHTLSHYGTECFTYFCTEFMGRKKNQRSIIKQ